MRPQQRSFNHVKIKKTARITIQTWSSNIIPMKRDPLGGGVNFLPSYSSIHLYVSRKFDITVISIRWKSLRFNFSNGNKITMSQWTFN